MIAAGAAGAAIGAVLLAAGTRASGTAARGWRRRTRAPLASRRGRISRTPRGIGTQDGGWAGGRDLRPLVVRPARGGPPPGRIVIGRVGRRLLAGEPRQSVIVFGPTQSRKTTGFAVPAILDWEGPVVATSVKSDLVRDTVGYRSRIGEVACLDPGGATGLGSVRWDPVAASGTWPAAAAVAAGLTDAACRTSGAMEEGAFWYAMAAKLLAPLLLAASIAGGNVADVARWLDTGDELEARRLLAEADAEAALGALIASCGRDERTRSSVSATAEHVVDPLVVGAGPLPVLDPEAAIAGRATTYLCAPATDQRRLAPLFSGAVRQVLDAAIGRSVASGRPLDPPLLVVLDEAANIAPLEDLDALASTAAGHGIQLVTVWHDLAQLQERYRTRSATVVNNHRAKVFLAGISDPATLEHASLLCGDAPVEEHSSTWDRDRRSVTVARVRRRLVPPDSLRRMAPGSGLLVYGGLPPAVVELRSWFEDPLLAARGASGRSVGA